MPSALGRLLLGVALLSCRAETSDNNVYEKILAFAGGSVVLPCHVTVSGDIPTVEWSKEGLDPTIAFLYRDGCETFEMKSPVFWYRTNLMMNEVKNGNMSLLISNVQLSDAGKYRCMILRRTSRQVVATLELLVYAVSEPRLSVVPGVDDGVTLQCEADCWSPVPEITFLDDRGNHIKAEKPKTRQDSRGRFTVAQTATVQTDTHRVTCRAHQPQINQTRDAEIYIPAIYRRSCTVTFIIAVVVTVFLLGLGSLAFAALHHKCGSCVGRKQPPGSKEPSDQSTTSRNADGDEDTTTEYPRNRGTGF
ncbi:butyrophilin subfamily 1 member A1-like isoform X2 [Xiphias gladius]|uniref:butyrophilin subfamily 1 member A1-like isoform X2 n=1 Tax=Xiphias gladius TaxID=8245 RepID=UPI001A9886CF|nr:butyrophilin subfamily 1 member A1-like isoform X2 [Xiphias gladius]